MNEFTELAKHDTYQEDIKSIEELKKRIQEEKRNLTRIKRQKRMYEIDLQIKRFYPYLLSAGIVFIGFSQRGQYPFYQERQHPYDEYIYQFSSDNSSLSRDEYSEKLKINKDLIDTISYYEPWIQNENQTYSQTISIYSIAQKEKEHLLAYYDNPANCNYQEFLNRLISSKTNDSSFLSDAKRKKSDYYKVIVKTKELNPNIYRRESKEENIIDTVLYVLINSILMGVIYLHRISKQISFKKFYKVLQDNYQSEIEETEKQILSLTKDLKKGKN